MLKNQYAVIRHYLQTSSEKVDFVVSEHNTHIGATLSKMALEGGDSGGAVGLHYVYQIYNAADFDTYSSNEVGIWYIDSEGAKNVSRRKVYWVSGLELHSDSAVIN